MSREIATKQLAKALNLDMHVVSTIMRYGAVKIEDDSVRFGGHHEFDAMGNASWTHASVVSSLQAYQAFYVKRTGELENDICKEMETAISRVPDDTACAAIGWYTRGYQLCDHMQGMIFANGQNDALVGNLISALDASRLSDSTVSILAEDIEALELREGVLPALQLRIDILLEDEEDRREARKEEQAAKKTSDDDSDE
jgi:hypothetical protein